MPDDLFIRSPGPIIQIGQAISERLEHAFPPAKFSHMFVPAKLDAAQWIKLLRRTPFVGLGFGDIVPNPGSGTLFNGLVTWVVFLATRNETGPRERFYGDKLAPGALQMLQAAVGILQGRTLKADGTALGTVFVTSAANAYAEDWKDDALAMVQLHLQVPVNFGPADVFGGDETVPGTLDGTAVRWSFDGGGSFPLTDQTTGGA